VAGLAAGVSDQTLLGVTGSGKTFTIANVVQQIQRPTLILSHNKTLAAQLYGEFKQFFPENSIEYFVSYYDYYQPEAYLPTTGVYIEKDLQINDEIEKLRLSATSALLSGRKDVLVVASVSCIYGIGNPQEFRESILHLTVGQSVARNKFLFRLVENLYQRAGDKFERGMFRAIGETVDIFLAYADYAIRIGFWGDEIETISSIDPETSERIETFKEIDIFPANLFVSSPDNTRQAIEQIQDDLVVQVQNFKEDGKLEESKRLDERVNYDLEMIRELGYCSGIENYSRYFDRRQPGERPFCLLDYFPDDFLLVIDESHVTLPQVRGMYAGDRARKTNLIDYGFRLQAAIDNRPLKFEEFEGFLNNTQLDFVTYKASLKQYLSQQTQFQDYDFEGSNLSVLLDLLAYNTYHNAMYLNMIGSEMFLDTAQLRESVVSHAKELNYIPRSRSSSSVEVTFIASPTDDPNTIVLPAYYSISGNNTTNNYTFSTNNAIILSKANNYIANITFYEGTVRTEAFIVGANNANSVFELSSNTIDSSSIQVQVRNSSSDLTTTTWNKMNDIYGLTANSEVFFVQAASEFKYAITFGNDVIGKKLIPGNIVLVSYRETSGEEGNSISNFRVNIPAYGYSANTFTITNTEPSSTPDSISPAGAGSRSTLPWGKHSASRAIS
jgi:hypothetical protein